MSRLMVHESWNNGGKELRRIASLEKRNQEITDLWTFGSRYTNDPSPSQNARKMPVHRHSRCESCLTEASHNLHKKCFHVP